MRATRLLLWLWKVLPLPRRLRWAIMWLGNTKYLVGALAAIFDAEGKILLQRHTYRKHYPWGMPGGWIGHRERPAEALAREVSEETGLRVTVGPLVAARGGRNQPRLVLTYLCTAEGTPRLSVETSEVRYFPVCALPADLSPDQVTPIQTAARVWQYLSRSCPPMESEAALWDIGDAPEQDIEEAYE